MIDVIMVAVFVIIGIAALLADGVHREPSEDNLAPAMSWALFIPLLLLVAAWVVMYWTGGL